MTRSPVQRSGRILVQGVSRYGKGPRHNPDQMPFQRPVQWTRQRMAHVSLRRRRLARKLTTLVVQRGVGGPRRVGGPGRPLRGLLAGPGPQGDPPPHLELRPARIFIALASRRWRLRRSVPARLPSTYPSRSRFQGSEATTMLRSPDTVLANRCPAMLVSSCKFPCTVILRTFRCGRARDHSLVKCRVCR